MDTSWLEWETPPERLELGQDETHVWRISLELGSESLERLRCSLSEDELERSNRFKFQEGRRRYIAARGCLRNILAHYLNLEASKLRFVYNSHGKPELAKGYGYKSLTFNLSHSHELGLIAVAWNRQVGVDLEMIRSNVEREKLAERFFSEREVSDLKSVPDEMRERAFFACWTRKEAFIKASGQGLSLPLDQFDVSLNLQNPPVIFAIHGDEIEARKWSLFHLDPHPGYVAALAIYDRDLRLHCWQWTGEWGFQGGDYA